MKRFKKAYNICSRLYFTVFKNIIKSSEQSNKMSIKNDVVSKNSRIQIQISQFSSQQQQQKTIKKILISEKKVKIAKTLKEYFVNRSIVISKNKEMTKKFITKINRNSKNVENKKKLRVSHSKLIY